MSYSETKEIIGRGAFSNIFLGYNHEGEKIAIKKIDDTCNILPELLLFNLDHENIIKPLGLRMNNNVSIVYTYYPNNLKLFLKKNEINNQIFDSITQQLLCAVAYLHSNNIIHCDIKCDNILINVEKMKIKLIDFNLSCLKMKNKKSFGHIVCAKTFRAPEVGKTRWDEKIDSWSCGVVLYYTLYKRYPKEDFEEQLIFKDLLIKNPCERAYVGDVVKNLYNISYEKKELLSKNVLRMHLIKSNMLNEHSSFGIYDNIINNLTRTKITKKNMKEQIMIFRNYLRD